VTPLNTLASKAYKGKTYADHVHFVHVYTLEAHPKKPDISPYSGKVWEMTYSTYGQQKTYTGRVQNAKNQLPKLTGKQLLLVDDLTPGTYNNPAWCTYGPCPNCSFLIDQQGKLVQVLTKTPSTQAALETALQTLLK
jgi:hypothetical protein